MKKDLYQAILDAAHAWKKDVLGKDGGTLPSEEDMRAEFENAADEFIGSDSDDGDEEKSAA